eukprot:13097322-Alexandrium_andersonii.AAC.1
MGRVPLEACVPLSEARCGGETAHAGTRMQCTFQCVKQKSTRTPSSAGTSTHPSQNAAYCEVQRRG